MSEREGSDADIFMIDLHAGFPNLAAKTTTLRLREALQDHALKAAYISHIGGFPVRKIANDTYTVLGQEITPEFMQKHLIEAQDWCVTFVTVPIAVSNTKMEKSC